MWVVVKVVVLVFARGVGVIAAGAGRDGDRLSGWSAHDKALLRTCHIAVAVAVAAGVRSDAQEMSSRQPVWASGSYRALGRRDGRWRVVHKGRLDVERDGVSFAGPPARWVSWEAVRATVLAPGRVRLELATDTWVLCSDWAELVFIVWALTRRRDHPHVRSGRWLPEGWIEHAPAHHHPCPFAGSGGLLVTARLAGAAAATTLASPLASPDGSATAVRESATNVVAITARRSRRPGTEQPPPADHDPVGWPVEAMLHLARDVLSMDVSMLTEIVDGLEIVRQAAGGWPGVTSQALVGQSLPLSATFCERLLEGTRAQYVADVCGDPSAAHLALAQTFGVGAWIGSLVPRRDARLYVLCCLALERRPGLGEEDARLARALAESLAQRLEVSPPAT